MEDRRHNEDRIIQTLAVQGERLVNLTEKLETFIDEMKETNRLLRDAHTGLDTRVRALEIEGGENRGRNRVSSAIWGALASFGFWIIQHFIGNRI